MIILPAYLNGFSSKTDGSASLRFSTQEIPPEVFAELSKNLNNFGHLLFKENEIDLNDVPKEDIDDKDKTPSKRLRNTLFVLWKQKGSKGDFEVYYREMVEKYITRIKAELD